MGSSPCNIQVVNHCKRLGGTMARIQVQWNRRKNVQMMRSGVVRGRRWPGKWVNEEGQWGVERTCFCDVLNGKSSGRGGKTWFLFDGMGSQGKSESCLEVSGGDRQLEPRLVAFQLRPSFFAEFLVLRALDTSAV